MFENERFEFFLLADPNFKFLSKCIFFEWDGNHMLHVWLPYINCLHNDGPSWHIYIDSIILDTSHGLVELLIAMTKFNKYVLEPFFFSYVKLDLNDYVLITLSIFAGWWS
jgi:hypothetical protein